MQTVANERLRPGDELIIDWDDVGGRKVTLTFTDGAVVTTHVDRNHPVTIGGGQQSVVVSLDDYESIKQDI